MRQTKIFVYDVIFKCWGTQSVEVPIDFTQEQAEQYVREHWDEMPIPTGEYIPNSDEPDFENSEFTFMENINTKAYPL